MSENSTSITDSNGVYAFDPPLAKTIKFWLLLFSESTSIPVYLFVIYHLLAHRSTRKALHNHAIIANLFVNFVIITIDLSMHLGYLRLGYVVPSTAGACLLWQLVDYGFWFGDIFLTFWTSIERHILIFHSNMVSTAHRRLIVHWIPLVFFSLYSPIVYIYLIFFYPVTHDYDFTLLLCGGPYYYNGIQAWMIWYESLVHYVIPILLIIMLSAGLLLRVVVQKHHLRLATGWRQYRKMTIQFICISVVYIFDLPYVIVTIVRWSGLSNFGIDVQGPYFYYVNYIPNILFPFAILGTMPKLKEKFSALSFWKANRTRVSVGPQTIRRNEHPETVMVLN